ncbi:MAG: hypothetical protein OXQ89_05630 [Rhodospirillaceae bacterium]|nr:hypothetical protein [Rhodospirillaceae bacterium]MDE0361339.1 hypothetical protein [Rhodospirillaceae bacterium]
MILANALDTSAPQGGPPAPFGAGPDRRRPDPDGLTGVLRAFYVGGLELLPFIAPP